MKAKEINVERVKSIIFDLLPSYWHPEIDKVYVRVYDDETFINLEREYVAFNYQYTSLGKVFLGDKFLARSGSIYGVWLERECETLEDAIKFAVEHSFR